MDDWYVMLTSRIYTDFGINPQATMVITLGSDTGNKNKNSKGATFRSAGHSTGIRHNESLENFKLWMTQRFKVCENNLFKMIKWLLTMLRKNKGRSKMKQYESNTATIIWDKQ